MDIAAWLQSLGLREYADTFRTHAIDVEILADLTEADLREDRHSAWPSQKIIRAIIPSKTRRPRKRSQWQVLPWRAKRANDDK
jgi:hypothetical protein